MDVKFIQATNEDLVCYIARVSNPENQDNTETYPRLIKYLIKHNHWSPFESAFMTVEITTSRAIAAQILRHRSFTYQEMSLRYSKATAREAYEARRQDTKNRQNSINDLTLDDKRWFEVAQDLVWDYCYEKYEDALALGIAREQARFLLPLSTATTLYMSGTIRSFIHYIQIRTEPGVQKEHRDIALRIKEMFKHHFPNTAEALEW